MKSKSVFTLIELLVVVAIIGILLSILMPSLSSARGVAKTAVCLSNVKQLSYAYLQYSDENHQKTIPMPATTNTAWFEYIYPYHGSEKIIQCPSVDHSGSGWRWGSNVTGWGGDSGWMKHNGMDASGSYGINGFTYNDLTWSSELAFKNLADPENPSNTPLFMDMTWVDAWQHGSNANPTTTDGSGGSMARVYLYRHVNYKTNVSMIDGSAKTIPVTNLLQLDWQKDPTYRVLPRL
ncbi:MAG: type II secretion system GspH family protein [Lentisphaeraceae bacterium]|nr:type II secretion system GspH family protein [Lentisphaeraceae bacterium]